MEQEQEYRVAEYAGVFSVEVKVETKAWPWSRPVYKWANIGAAIYEGSFFGSLKAA